MIIILVFIFATLLCFSRNKSLLHIVVFLLALFFAFRSDLVPDAYAYRMYYYERDFASLEKGYLSFSRFFYRNLHLSFEAFLFVISITALEAWLWTTKRISSINDVCYQLPLMLSFMGFYFYGIVLRSAIAITICYSFFPILLYSKKIIRFGIYLLGVLLAMQFHLTALLFALVPLFLLKCNSKVLHVANLISLLLLLANEVIPIQSYMYEVVDRLGFFRFNSYLMQDVETERANILAFYFLIISVLSVLFKNKLNFINEKEKYTYDFFVNLIVFGTLLNSLVWQIPAMSRLSMQWLFFTSYVIYIFLFRNKIKFIQQNKISISLMFCAVQLFALLHYYPLIVNYLSF